MAPANTAPSDALLDARERLAWAPPERVYECLMRIGGCEGYYTDSALWALRSTLGPLLCPEPRGGDANDGPRASGDRFDHWRVVEAQPGRAFAIVSRMRGLGETGIAWRLDPRPGSRCVVTQTASLRPRGAFGPAYWALTSPAHAYVFSRLLDGIARRAERDSPPPPPQRPTSGLRIVRREIVVPRPMDETFSFFADARNLEAITPAWLRFHIVTPAPIAMSEGTLIDYRLRIRGFPVEWNTRIDVWDPPHRFVDRQLRGPYRWWHHEHRFEETEGGTRVIDEVEYQSPLRWIADPLLVRRDVERIFDHRSERLEALLGAANTPGSALV